MATINHKQSWFGARPRETRSRFLLHDLAVVSTASRTKAPTSVVRRPLVIVSARGLSYVEPRPPPLSPLRHHFPLCLMDKSINRTVFHTHLPNIMYRDVVHERYRWYKFETRY
ncbi:hypothetical protein EVAR_19999_1 [Eumeta japonica]|uniref:Uncharacterized protein n=1 Tax=Eumeta variegata TaxID=151549 RepID=A0A4C1VA13_EUMVA|nr:hypothetical protein EVAR_19999_1 [Eumeta japonica]